MCTSDILIGSTAQENWDIIEESSPDFTWLHLNSFPSPHVIIKSELPSHSEILEAASLCKSKSKYKHIRNIKVVYCKVSNLELAETVGSVNILSKRKCKYVTPTF